MEHKTIVWDYKDPPRDELWQARRLAEFFPFVAFELTPDDKALILRHLEKLRLPPERKEAIRLACESG